MTYAGFPTYPQPKFSDFITATFITALAILPLFKPCQRSRHCRIQCHSIHPGFTHFLLHGTTLVPCPILHLETSTTLLKPSTVIILSRKLILNSYPIKSTYTVLYKCRPYFIIIVCLHIFLPTRMRVSRSATPHFNAHHLTMCI